MPNETALTGTALKDALEAFRAVVACPHCGSTNLAQQLHIFITQKVKVWTCDESSRDFSIYGKTYDFGDQTPNDLDWEANDSAEAFFCLDCKMEVAHDDAVITVRPEQPALLVDIYDVDQDTGVETLSARGVQFADAFPEEDEEARAALAALRAGGEALVGGGASPAVRLSVTIDSGTSGVLRITPTAEAR